MTASLFQGFSLPWGRRKSWLATLRATLRKSQRRPRLSIPSDATDVETATRRMLLYVMLPAWMVPGFVDWAYHRRTNIEHTSGTGEAVIHCMMLTQVGVPVMMGLLLEINPLTLSLMMGHTVVHAATAFADVSYAVNHHRDLAPGEQHTHSFLEVLPVMALSSIICLHWDQFLAIWGIGGRKGRWRFALKKHRLPEGYLRNSLLALTATIVLPYANELYRCIRAQRRRAASNPGRIPPPKPAALADAPAASAPEEAPALEAI